MDYDIKVDNLTSKTAEVDELKTKCEDVYNEFNSCYISSINDPELSSLPKNMKTPIDRLKNGMTNSATWYKNYLEETNAVEDSLSSFDGKSLTSPSEFSGEFVDMFGKRTMPIIKTGGDIHANAKEFGGVVGDTQAKEFYDLGDRAYNGDKKAMEEWIELVGKIVKNTNTYGMKKSLIIAQIINESGWMSHHCKSLSDFNNVLGINTDMGKITPDMQDSTWSKKRTSGNNNVTQWSKDGSHIIGTNESMRHYDSIEECIEDYANVMYLYHPECKGSNNLEDYRSFLEGYTPNPNGSTTNKYKNIINKYNLDRFDV